MAYPPPQSPGESMIANQGFRIRGLSDSHTQLSTITLELTHERRTLVRQSRYFDTIRALVDRRNPTDRPSQIRINQKRYQRRIQGKAKAGKVHQVQIPGSLTATLRQCDRFLNAKNIASLKGRNLYIPIPRQFSFIENPEGTLNVMASLLGAHNKVGVESVHLDHSCCELLDLGASVVMDVIALELIKSWRRRKPAIHFSGRYPTNVKVQEILRTSGIIHQLQVPGHTLSELPHVKCLHLISGKQEVKTYRSSPQEKAQQEFAEYINKCLLTQGYKLTEHGSGDICRMVGEILTNAEEHSNLDKWYIIGYLTQEQVSGPGQCNLAIFNFGRTIYETLSSADTCPQVRGQMEKLSSFHTKRGLFRSGWSEEALWTLYSLQEGVSRFTGGSKGPSRGMGTVKMIDFFLKLGHQTTDSRNPKMMLLSGSSHILFDGKYKLKEQQIGNEYRQVIAFNKDNDLRQPPDSDYVRSLKGIFPGTLISMRFFLDKNYLESVSN